MAGPWSSACPLVDLDDRHQDGQDDQQHDGTHADDQHGLQRCRQGHRAALDFGGHLVNYGQASGPIPPFEIPRLAGKSAADAASRRKKRG